MVSAPSAFNVRRIAFAAVVRQRWRWPPSPTHASLSSVNFAQQRKLSSSTDRSVRDGWLPASAQSRRTPYRSTYPAPSFESSSTLLTRVGVCVQPSLRAAAFSTQTDEEGGKHVESGGDDGNDEVQPVESAATEEKLGAIVASKKSSVLDELPQPFEPAAAYNCLRAHHPKGSAISLRDFRRLCLSARPGRGRDAKKIAQALRDFKKHHLFSVDSAGSRVAMEGMVRSRTPIFEDSVATPEQKAEAVIFALEKGWLDVKGTNVYYAYPTKGVDHWLEVLLDCVRESEGRIRLPDGFDHTKHLSLPKRKRKEDDEDADREDVNKLLPVRLLSTVQRTVHLLIRRGSHPEREMKRRKARRYRKALRLTAEEGNATPLSVHLGVQIALELGGTSECAKDVALTQFRKMGNRHMEMEETVWLIAETLKKERVAQAEAEEAATRAEAEAAVEAEEDEENKSNNDDGVEKDEEDKDS